LAAVPASHAFCMILFWQMAISSQKSRFLDTIHL